MNEETDVSEIEFPDSECEASPEPGVSLDESNQAGPLDNEPTQEADVVDEPVFDELPTYLCHKEVQAAQIFAVAPRPQGGAFLHFEGDYSRFRVSGIWMSKHEPEPGGYFVIYKDGYHSYSPQEAFEDGYSLKGVQSE